MSANAFVHNFKGQATKAYEMQSANTQLVPLLQCVDSKLMGALMTESLQDKQKRHRRRAALIDRHYQCPVQACSKNYGSEGSLNQHLKLKHPGVQLAKKKDA